MQTVSLWEAAGAARGRAALLAKGNWYMWAVQDRRPATFEQRQA
jgi:hypothetical protein